MAKRIHRYLVTDQFNHNCCFKISKRISDMLKWPYILKHKPAVISHHLCHILERSRRSQAHSAKRDHMDYWGSLSIFSTSINIQLSLSDISMNQIFPIRILNLDILQRKSVLSSSRAFKSNLLADLQPSIQICQLSLNWHKDLFPSQTLRFTPICYPLSISKFSIIGDNTRYSWITDEQMAIYTLLLIPYITNAQSSLLG